jgi:hypothetical protein
MVGSLVSMVATTSLTSGIGGDDADGLGEGEREGVEVGDFVGTFVGGLVGDFVGVCDGAFEGEGIGGRSISKALELTSPPTKKVLDP